MITVLKYAAYFSVGSYLLIRVGEKILPPTLFISLPTVVKGAIVISAIPEMWIDNQITGWSPLKGL